MTKKRTTDANLILAQLAGDDLARKDSFNGEMANRQVGSMIFEIRTRAGLTQKQLGARIGTTQSVISRLEDADYAGSPFPMLYRVADAMKFDVEIRVVPRLQKPLVPHRSLLRSPKGNKRKAGFIPVVGPKGTGGKARRGPEAIEDERDYRLASDSWDNHLRNKTRLYTGEEVWRELGLRDQRKEPARLSSKNREKLARIGRIHRQARESFSTNKAVSVWLRSPAPALKGALPIDLLETEQGAKDVEAVLNGIAHGNVM